MAEKTHTKTGELEYLLESHPFRWGKGRTALNKGADETATAWKEGSNGVATGGLPPSRKETLPHQKVRTVMKEKTTLPKRDNPRFKVSTLERRVRGA